MNNTYTFETYREENRTCARIHAGNFDSNRDCLSPQMRDAREFEAANDKEALRKGRQAATTLGARFVKA